MSDATISLESLGLSRDEISERVVDKAVQCLLSDTVADEDGDEHHPPSRFAEAMKKRVTERVGAAIDEIAGRHVLPNVASYVETLCLTETNKWGEKKGATVTFVEYLVQRAESYLQEKVNYEGKSQTEAGDYSWSPSQTRIAHLVHQHLHHSIETAMKAAIKPANDQIARAIQETVKIKLAEIAAQLTVAVGPRR